MLFTLTARLLSNNYDETNAIRPEMATNLAIPTSQSQISQQKLPAFISLNHLNTLFVAMHRYMSGWIVRDGLL